MTPRFLELPEVDSTNSFLANEAEAMVPFAGVFSWNQTHGRGRAGRSWESLPGKTLAVSLRFPNARPSAQISWLPLLAGHVLCSLLRSRGLLRAGVKWPNDILIGEAKLAGILVEKHPTFCVVGIGVNVGASPTLSSGHLATSLRAEGFEPIDVVSDLIEPIFYGLEELLGLPGTEEQVVASWRQLVLGTLDTLGHHVEFRGAEEQVGRGVAADLAIDGALLVDIPGENRTVSVYSGDVFQLGRS
jgi:BirA family biotin operon repressor/biotin-[acetyl-CoA-carboxylase] ligase